MATSEYSSGRSVYLHVGELPPGRYILIPSTYAPREEAEFMLRIYSTSRTLNPVLLEEDMPRGFSGCGFRARCITRLRIVDLEMFGQLQKGVGSGGIQQEFISFNRVRSFLPCHQ